MPDAGERPALRIHGADPGAEAPYLDVVIPASEAAEALTVREARLRDYLGPRLPFSWRITIIDDAPDRGNALRTAWAASRAAVVAYIDFDSDLLLLAERDGVRLAPAVMVDLAGIVRTARAFAGLGLDDLPGEPAEPVETAGARDVAGTARRVVSLVAAGVAGACVAGVVRGARRLSRAPGAQ